MKGVVRDLPGRLRATATALANARAERSGGISFDAILEVLPEAERDEAIEDARAVLDAADAADPVVAPLANDQRGSDRIKLAATVGLDLQAQAVVLFDVARDGTVTHSTWAAGAGTPSRAIAEWARLVQAQDVAIVPFQTVFGWGRGGRPTPLTDAQRASLPPGRAGLRRAQLDRPGRGVGPAPGRERCRKPRPRTRPRHDPHPAPRSIGPGSCRALGHERRCHRP